MATPEEEVQAMRSKRTKLLLAGGAASLILPLFGVAYLKIGEAKTARPPDSSVTFDRRERGDEKVVVSQSIAMPVPGSQAAGPSSLPVAGGMTVTPAPENGSSLDFVKGGTNNTYFQDKAAAPAPSTATAAATAAAPAAAPPPEPAPQVAAKKTGKKPFVMPKLNGSSNFSSGFTKAGSPKAGAAKPGAAGAHGVPGAAGIPAGVPGGAEMAEMLKKVPGGANNPEVQKYLKSQQGK